MYEHGFAVPDRPESLLDADGTMIRGRPVVTIGMTAGRSLPRALQERLDADAVPYRLVPVASKDQLVVYAPTGAVQGVDAILDWLATGYPAQCPSNRPPAPTVGS